MFRRSEISAISREINRLLTHKGWRTFKDHWDRYSIDRFLDRRAREMKNNPFLRRGNQFDAYEETLAFLNEVLQAFVDRYAGGASMRYMHAARELAATLNVHIPEPTPRREVPAYLFPSFSDDGFPARPSPMIEARPAPGMHYARTPSGTAFDTPQLPPPDSSWTNPMGHSRAQQLQLAHASAEPSDDHRVAALQVLMTHPSTPEHERRAALEAYLRLLAKRNGSG